MMKTIYGHSRSNRKTFRFWTIGIALLILLGGCSNDSNENQNSGLDTNQVEQPSSGPEETQQKPNLVIPEVPEMGESEGVFYEIFVRSFSDSDGDGIGDFKGVVQKLDYLKDLGVSGIWLMPIQPSPSYHGYDVTDYYTVNPDYGTIDDFQLLLEEAHARDIQVIMDLVVNHTSKEHPWFTDSAQGEESPYRDWYIWTDSDEEASERGPWDQQVWHAYGTWKYLGVFWDGMPDLNMDHPDVREEMIAIGQHWLEMGVDGFRIDAAKHVYEDFKSSASNPETAQKNQQFFQEFREGLNEVNQSAYVIGEVWDTPAVVGPFLKDALSSGFNFDLAQILLSSAKSERAATFASRLNQTYEFFSEQSSGQFVDAPFLTNHDQNRVMSELGGNVDRAKMAASLLLTMPGNPFIYYGEEIGMKGEKPDERIREPMVWSADASAPNQTSWEPSLYQEGVDPVDVQLQDPDSLLNHYKEMISWRNEEEVLRDGGIAPFEVTNDGVLGFLRILDDDSALVMHNLTGETKQVDLNENVIVPYKEITHSTIEMKLENGILTMPPYSSAMLK
ncbi:alpha-amylase family glycosyl hydrolase [Marinicrinis lubricantis]|uniref:Alpha-amylase family glycosyl hydrolase n=1 Tax=Marinicrinis lubricantis TaxID=2086470 RepID=A0ABW1IJ57_9BACL